MPGEFTLTDRNGICHAFDCLEPSFAKETLGILIAPDGNQKLLVLLLRKKSEDFGEKRSSQCTADTAMYTYNTCFLKSIEYSCIVTNFDSDQWNKILAPALENLLTKSALTRKFPR